MQARIACGNGEARQAIMFYDRLIAELTTALAPGTIGKQAITEGYRQ
jgi:hypothetical protein